jgi:hypothetical protein
MKIIYKISKITLCVLALAFVVSSCQKMTQPAMGTYLTDANAPGGPLKFYVAFDGTSTNVYKNAVDSIRANFPGTYTATFATGISGNCYKGSETAFATYASPNDFTSASSFSVAFWIKKTPQAAGKGTNFAFSLNARGYSWTNTKMFLEFEDAGNGGNTSTSDVAKFYLMDQWIEYSAGSGHPLTNALDGNWHHLAFTYSETTSTLIAYQDGVLIASNVISGLGAVNFGTYTDFTIGGPNQYTHDNNSWMGFWDGQLDQFRLYGTVLSASDIAALYTGKK